MNWLAVAIGGALGAIARYGVALLIPTVAGRFPWATFSANLIGSFLIGVAYVVIVQKQIFSPEMRLWLMTGFLGGFTTFSSFSLETLQLWQQGQSLHALIYVITSVISCLIAVAVAVSVAQKFFI